MATTYLHRALDPDAAQYVYWYSDLPYDGSGTDYSGPPEFSTLQNVTMIQAFILPNPGVNFEVDEQAEDFLIDFIRVG